MTRPIYRDRPTLYLTNAATVGAVRRGSARSKACVGPGRVLSILRKPPRWVAGMVDGSVPLLMPTRGELASALLARADDGGAAFAAYAAGLLDRWGRINAVAGYNPGALPVATPCAASVGRLAVVEPWDGTDWRRVGLVQDGDTLVCTCARGAPCHRLAATVMLERNGWRIVLDGVVGPHGDLSAMFATRVA